MCWGKFCSNLNNARVPLRVILSPQVFPIDLLAPRVRARHCTCASLSPRSSGPHYRSQPHWSKGYVCSLRTVKSLGPKCFVRSGEMSVLLRLAKRQTLKTLL